jgi:hypothetical protein
MLNQALTLILAVILNGASNLTPSLTLARCARLTAAARRYRRGGGAAQGGPRAVDQQPSGRLRLERGGDHPQQPGRRRRRGRACRPARGTAQARAPSHAIPLYSYTRGRGYACVRCAEQGAGALSLTLTTCPISTAGTSRRSRGLVRLRLARLRLCAHFAAGSPRRYSNPSPALSPSPNTSPTPTSNPLLNDARPGSPRRRPRAEAGRSPAFSALWGRACSG